MMLKQAQGIGRSFQIAFLHVHIVFWMGCRKTELSCQNPVTCWYSTAPVFLFSIDCINSPSAIWRLTSCRNDSQIWRIYANARLMHQGYIKSLFLKDLQFCFCSLNNFFSQAINFSHLYSLLQGTEKGSES